jgi:hypothetical protein
VPSIARTPRRSRTWCSSPTAPGGGGPGRARALGGRSPPGCRQPIGDHHPRGADHPRRDSRGSPTTTAPNGSPPCSPRRWAACPAWCAARSPRATAVRWRPTPASAWPPASPCSSATPKALTARVQRDHQRPAAPVLSEQRRPIDSQPSRPRQRRSPAHQPTLRDPRILEAIREAGGAASGAR